MLRTVRRMLSSRVFRRPEPLQSAFGVICWWEKRRPFYSAVVVAALICGGVPMLLTAVICESHGGDPVGLPDPIGILIFVAAAYCFMANVCYTAGWFLELMVRVLSKEKAAWLGEAAFAGGILFSVVLTLLPGALFTVFVSIPMLFNGIPPALPPP